MMRRCSRRSFQEVYFWGIVLMGTAATVISHPDWSREPMVAVTLVILFTLAEYFLTRVKVGGISFSFPIAYAAYLLYGVNGAVWAATAGTILANLIRGRAWRVTWFNGAQFALAALAAGHLSLWWAGPPLLHRPVLALALYLTVYYTLNNLIVDGFLWLRLNHYRLSDWQMKNRFEAFSALVSFAYALLMVFLAPQNRGHDPLSLIFFFLPLLTVGGFVRLLINISRFANQMATLMEVSTLVTFHPESQALETALSHLDSFDDYQFAAIYLLEEDELALRAVYGIASEQLSHRRIAVGEGLTGWAARHARTVVAGKARQDTRNTIGEGVKEHAAAMAAIPLISSGQVIGVFTVGKERAYSLQPEDQRVLTIFANLVAAILRNMTLAEERERLLLVQERSRLARDIHDGLAQSLAGAILQIDRLERLIETDPRGALRLLATLRENAREILLEVRRSIFNLRLSPLEEHGLVGTLRQEIERLREKGLLGPTQVRFEVRGEQRSLSGLVEDQVFHIAQEGLTNALKHAGASEIAVGLHFFGDRLRLIIRDNGRGFHLADAVRASRGGQQFGLIGMHERAGRLGASLDVQSRPGAGTRVTVEVPLLGE
ncbi:MAG: GAF domain-containing protein [Bacillota bacterium]